MLKQKDKFESVFINDVGNVTWNIDDDLDSTEHWENQNGNRNFRFYVTECLRIWLQGHVRLM